VRKRSRSLHGTDEPRAEGPAQGEPRSPSKESADETGSPLGAPPTGGEARHPGGGRRRRSKRGADRGARQGTLFDELDAGKPQKTDGPASGEGGTESADTPKSRSKRRRERRKATRAGQQQAQSTGTEGTEGVTVPSVQGSSGRPYSKDRRNDPRQNALKRGPDKSATGRRPMPGARASSERSQREKNRSRSDSGSPREQARRSMRPQRPSDSQPGRGSGRPDGLPPLTEEDLGALHHMGEEGFPFPLSNISGHPSMRKPVATVRPLEVLAPSAESLAAIEALEAIVDENFPLQAKHRAGLKGDIRKLWEELTSDRESRSVDYLGTPSALSAYLRYFLPWNVFRLSAILSNADFCLADNSVVVDIGSGPLTVVIALWAARPELREVPLTIYCIDRVERVLDAGRSVFETLCLRLDGRIPPWRIETRKESFGAAIPERAHLLTAANVFNEFFWKDHRNLGERALDTARILLSYLRENGSLFIMEPGDPRSGAFISSLRAALLAEGALPLGPCPHSLSCPMPGIFRHLLPPEETRTIKNDPNIAPSRFVLPPVVMPKKRDKFPWCHFGIDTIKAPGWLHALSEEAGLPKEKATLSYLWAARGAVSRSPVGVPSPVATTERERRARAGKGILVRVVSEPFALPDGTSGQYACSSLGYTLLKRQRGDEPYDSGNLLEVASSPLARNDAKSGAIILPT